MPIIYYITIYGKYSTEFYYIILNITLIVFVVILINKLPIKFAESFETDQIDTKLSAFDLENKVIKLSINVFRTSVFIITSVAIVACDFNVFERFHAKTQHFGISLMDLGVGLFIICNSMRVIRNSDGNTASQKYFKRLKKRNFL